MNLDSNVLNGVIAFSMALMSASLLLLVGGLLSVFGKSRDTLGAIERLADTVNHEVGPTAVQLREVMEGINQIKGVTTQRITAVTTKVETAADSVATVVDKTKKQSTVLGTGLLAGFREYLYGKQEISPDKQITMDRGDRAP